LVLWRGSLYVRVRAVRARRRTRGGAELRPADAAASARHTRATADPHGACARACLCVRVFRFTIRSCLSVCAVVLVCAWECRSGLCHMMIFVISGAQAWRACIENLQPLLDAVNLAANAGAHAVMTAGFVCVGFVHTCSVSQVYFVLYCIVLLCVSVRVQKCRCFNSVGHGIRFISSARCVHQSRVSPLRASMCVCSRL
jgi:hypothetical protein